MQNKRKIIENSIITQYQYLSLDINMWTMFCANRLLFVFQRLMFGKMRVLLQQPAPLHSTHEHRSKIVVRDLHKQELGERKWPNNNEPMT